MRAMHLRRSLALLSGALLLAAPLSSCGFDRATNKVNQIAAGTNNRDTSVDVLGAAVVSGEEGSGTFVATFVNNDLAEPAAVESLEAQDEQMAQVIDFTPIEIEPNGLVNLAESDERVAVEGDFEAGDRLPMVVSMAGGDAVEIDVPVVTNCDQWEGIDPVPGDCEVGEPVGEH
jgi:hypothetical protein